MKTTVVNIRNIPSNWETNPDYVYVGRPGRGHGGEWGNPHVIGRCPECRRFHSRDEAVAVHRDETWKRWMKDEAYRERMRTALKGKYLVCFCAPSLACHATVYAELVEGSL